MNRRAIRADLDRCTGCYSCVVACREENRLTSGLSLIRLVQVGPRGEFPRLTMYYLPLACQQCARPACALACSEEAIVRTDSEVTIEVERCSGCGLCAEACPYGAVSVDRSGGRAYKCDLCAAAGEATPVCIAACPAKALELIDPESADAVGAGGEDSGAERRPGDLTLKASAGTAPAGRFVLTRQTWEDVC